MDGKSNKKRFQCKNMKTRKNTFSQGKQNTVKMFCGKLLDWGVATVIEAMKLEESKLSLSTYLRMANSKLCCLEHVALPLLLLPVLLSSIWCRL